MTEASISFLFSVPAVLLLLGSSIVLLSQKKGREGTTEMFAGAVLIVITILGSFLMYIYSNNYQYSYEQNQSIFNSAHEVLINLFPLGLILFSVGIARFAKLLSIIRGRVSV